MAWHPDRSSHPEATERFKQIRAAYEALQRRDEPEEGVPEAATDAPQAQRATDIRIDLEVSLEEAAFGCEKSVTVDRGVACAGCDGSGESGISRSHPCQGCHGSGRVRHRHHGLEVCPQCGGRGYFSRRTCADCGGSGESRDRVSLQVTVPSGMLPGDELRLAGQGEPGGDDRLPGDLFLKLRIRRHALFELNGDELSCAMPVNALKLLAGGRIEVPALGGMAAIELAPGAIGARTIRLAGRGYPSRRSACSGDLVVHLQPVMPQCLDPEQLGLLQQAAEACEGRLAECLPEISAWRGRYGF